MRKIVQWDTTGYILLKYAQCMSGLTAVMKENIYYKNKAILHINLNPPPLKQ